MGFFSWHTNDTDKPIWNQHTQKHKLVYLIDNQNNKWAEPHYDGYGVFGGKDFYLLLAEMNNLEFKNYDDGRRKAIKFADENPNCLYPNLVSDPNSKWVNKEPRHHEGQGFWEV